MHRFGAAFRRVLPGAAVSTFASLSVASAVTAMPTHVAVADAAPVSAAHPADTGPAPLDGHGAAVGVTHRADLPTFGVEEVKAHATREDRLWVTLGVAVYDVTDFIDAHLGRADRLLMAGGGSLVPFWDVYRMHYRGHIVEFLEKFRIGNLTPDDANAMDAAFEFGDAFEDDPPRHPDCITCTPKPYCGEIRTDLLTASYYTPNELFYKRNHASVPTIDEGEYELVVEGPGMKTTTFTLEDLRTRFKHYDVVATLQCAGNRGEDYHGLGKGPTQGVFQAPHWNAGAISNAKWTGVRMRDLLAEAGLDVDAIASGKANINDLGVEPHIHFESYDEDETGKRYSASAPADKIIDPLGDCLIALKMNDRPLPRDHGFPARALVPGHAGARQPKWIHKLSLKPKASGVLQCLGFAPDVTFEDDLSVNWPPKEHMVQARVVQEMPVQSLVSQPPQRSIISGRSLDTLTLKGVAWSGGGSGIHRVDVSLDGGSTFTAADLFKPVVQHRRGQWGWTQFSKTVALPADVRDKLARGERVDLELTSKAVDSHYNVQPADPEPYVNPRGVAVNHWYRVKVTLDPSLPEGMVLNPMEEAAKQGLMANTPSGGQYHAPWRAHGWEAVKAGQKPGDWVKVATDANTQHEPGISKVVDWAFYRNIRTKPWFEQAKDAPTGAVKPKPAP